MSDELLKIKGRFRYCIFHSSNYGVFRFQSEEGPLVVTGPLVDIDTENVYLLSGFFMNHPKYGEQFKVCHFTKQLPSKKENIIRLLASSQFRGIGKKTAQKIVDILGEDSLSRLQDDPSLYAQLSLTSRQEKALRDGLAGLADPLVEQRMRFYQAGFTSDDCNIITNRYQEELFAILAEDPYRLFYEIEGLGFTKIDKYCLQEGFSVEDLRRKTALLVFLLQDKCFRSGDTILSCESLLHDYQQKTGFFDGEDVLLRAEKQHLISVKGDEVALYKYFVAEDFIAQRLLTFANESLKQEDDILSDLVQQVQNEEGICYSREQKQAILSFFHERFSLICGGPGTGKTTVVKALVSISKRLNPYVSIAIAAPTGRAAKRINELCGVPSHTIHSLLGWDKENNLFRYNETNPLLLDTLIIDEFSMVDTLLFASLLKASGAIKHICIIGDNQQLPSIRPGDVLADLLACEAFKYTYLKVNHRQQKGSEIICCAQEILAGELHFSQYHNEVFFLQDDKENTHFLQTTLNDLCQKYSADECQILSPMYAGNYGVDALNVFLQQVCNPDQGQAAHHCGKYLYREGDKLLQLKNQSTDDIYNGDIGYLLEIDKVHKSFVIDFDSRLVTTTFENLDNLRLAYAVSVHKAQGSEYPVVVLCISNMHRGLLDKKLLYTAVTRARSAIYIIGNMTALQHAIKRERRPRKSDLCANIRDYLDKNNFTSNP